MPEFPHLLPRERALWRLFLADPKRPAMTFDYDVHVGKGLPGPPNLGDPFDLMARTLAKKRIDVVGDTGSEKWLIEVSPHLGKTVDGGLNSYPVLYREATGYLGPITLAAVGETIDFDYRVLWERRGIEIFLYALS